MNKRKIAKGGISLVVLVVTIIVMIILATVVVLSLNQSNIVNKAADATESSNLKAIEEATEIEYANLMEASETGEIEMTDEELQNHMRQKLNEQGLDGSLVSVDNKEVIIAGLNEKFATTNDDFIFTIKTTYLNQAVIFPMYTERDDISTTANDFVIDYGDSSTEHITTDTKRENGVLIDTTFIKHTYARPGVHTVKISGRCKAIDQIEFDERYYDTYFGDDKYNASDIAKILSIVQWGNVQLECFVSTTVTGVLPIPKSTSFDKLIYMIIEGSNEIYSIPSNLLYGCDKLKEVSFSHANISEIPPTLFRDCINLEDISGVFSGTDIVSIPENLFDNCNKIKDCRHAFSETDIVSIPENLFENCNKIKDCSYAFNGCKNLTGTVPRIWAMSTIISSRSCYGGVTDAVTNYSEIPSECLVYDDN